MATALLATSQANPSVRERRRLMPTGGRYPSSASRLAPGVFFLFRLP
jgi:hypothetical protein